MMRIGSCVWAALIVALAACGGQKSGNEEQPANEAQQASQVRQPANEAQPASKVAAARKCPDFSTQLPVEVPDLTRKVYACVERNALLFANGPDELEAVSKAVTAKCKGTIVQYVDQEARKAGIRPQYKEPFASWQDHALAIIAEARARGC